MTLKAHYDTVLVEKRDGIAWVIFNRPEKKNAMNPQLHFDMEHVLMELETDAGIEVIVLTGAGDAWSAGMDLKEYFRDIDEDPTARFRASAADHRWGWQILSWSRKCTIAMVNGHCYGGAWIPLCACDFVITAEDASFGLSEVNWGIIPGGLVSKVIRDVLSYRDALFYALTGRTFDGRKAVEIGLANLAVPRERLREETERLAQELMRKSPAVLAYTKQAVRAVAGMDVERAYEYLGAKLDALRFNDAQQTRRRGLEGFLDQKAYRPGYEPVARREPPAGGAARGGET
jgi:trans-feruloyl-CoA hydratase/vanillin synthase